MILTFRHSIICLFALLLPMMLLVSHQSATSAAPLSPTAAITVTTTIPDANADGLCSLIEAIDNANDDAATHADCPAGAGADVIELTAGATYTVTAVHNTLSGDNGLPVVFTPMTINGHGATISRSTAEGIPAFRLFYIDVGGDLTLNELTISHGQSTATFSGGGLRNHGTLTLNGSVVENNLANEAGGGGLTSRSGTLSLHNSLVTGNAADHGGGISYGALIANSWMTITQSTIAGNSALGNGGGIVIGTNPGLVSTMVLEDSEISDNSAAARGGGLFVSRCPCSGTTNVAIANSLITNNSADEAGGIGLNYSNGTIRDSEISNNVADGLTNGVGTGGGISVQNSSIVTITRSTISSNTATVTPLVGVASGAGGGLVTCDSEVTLVNSTISGNKSVGDFGDPQSGGGGLTAISCDFLPSTVHLINTTIAGNTADTGGGGLSAFDLGFGLPVTTELKNTIIAGNSDALGNNCYTTPLLSLTSLGNNVEDGDSCNLSQPSDQPNTDPLLGSLAVNGGPTQTHALLAGSPAIDAGDNATCAAAPVQGIDQRGLARPADGNGDGNSLCDSGAYEAPSAYRLFLPVITGNVD